jgi:hypothetical protein
MTTPAPARSLAAAARSRRTFFRFALHEQDRRRLVALGLDALTLGITAAVFLILNKLFYFNRSGYDEEFFTWGGWCITKGLAPYRDFLEYKPPVSFITHGLAIWLFGLKDFGFRTFFTIVPLASVLTLQASLLSRGIERFFTLAVITGFLCLFLSPWYHDTALTDCESIVVMYYVFGLAGFLWKGRFENVATALGGFFMSCSVLSKEPIAGVVLGTWLGMFWLRQRPSLASAKFFARYSLLGVGVFVLLLSVYMVPTGSMAAYLRLLASYPRMFRDPKRSYCVLLGTAHADDGLSVAWDHMRAVFFNQTVLGFLTPLLVAGVIFAFQRSIWLVLSMVVVMAGAFWAGVASNCMWTHYCVMSMAGVLYLLVAGADSLRWPLAAASRGVRIATSAVAVLSIAWYVGPTLEHEYHVHYVRPPWPEPQPGLMHFIATHTKPTDRIFTTGTPQLYARADRLGATVQTNFTDEVIGAYEGATDDERMRPLREQLIKNMPKVVFLDPEQDSRKVRHTRLLVLPFLRDYNYERINDRLYFKP